MLQFATKFKPKAEAFETAKAAGFRHAEFWLDASWLSNWKSIVRKTRQSGLGVALHFPNRGELSKTTIREAVRLNPDLTEALGNLASLLLNTGRLDEAAENARTRGTRQFPPSMPARTGPRVARRRSGPPPGT